MSLKTNILPLSLMMAAGFAAGVLRAQPQTYREEITVVAPYEPTISDAFKINLKAVTGDTLPVRKTFAYDIRSSLLPTPFQPEPLKAARMVGEPLEKLYRNYLRAGMGNYVSPLVEYHYNSLRSKDLVYALRLEHRSSAGELEGAGYPGRSHNTVGFGIQRIGKKGSTLAGDIGFSRNVRHFYGFGADSLDVPPERDDYRQRYADINTSLAWFSHDPDPRRLQHRIGLKLGHFSDLDERGELQFDLDGGLKKAVNFLKEAGDQYVAVNAGAEVYRNTQPWEDPVITSLIRVRPEFGLTLGEFHLKAGLKAEAMSDTTTRLALYPLAEVRIHVLESAMSLFFGLDGGSRRNGLRALVDMNPFLADSVPLHFSDEKYRFYGGTEGRIGQRLGFQAMLSASRTEGMPFFVNDTASLWNHRFSLVNKEVTLFALRAGLSFQHSKALQSLASFHFNQYSPTEGTAWHVPELLGSLGLRYSLRDKIILEADAYAEGPRKARGFDIDGEERVEEMKGFIDAGLEIEYRYSKLLAAYLRCDNLLGKHYQQWYGYPVQGLRVQAGLSYSF